MDYKEKLLHAYKVAAMSNDPSTQNGAILFNEDDENSLVFEDCNRFPSNVEETDERWKRPLKYQFVEHAERNVIFHAAFHGMKLEGTTMVCPWSCCANCARAIIQSGVKRLVRHKQALDRLPAFGSEADRVKWNEEIQVADTMLKEAGVEVVDYDGSIGCDFEVRHSGVNWKP